MWGWSSTRALLGPERGEGLTETASVLARAPDIAALLASGEDDDLSSALRHSERTERPLGANAFLERVEQRLRRNPGAVRSDQIQSSAFALTTPKPRCLVTVALV